MSELKRSEVEWEGCLSAAPARVAPPQPTFRFRAFNFNYIYATRQTRCLAKMPTRPPPPAQPSKEIFDPFNSSATGHQRAENRLSGSTSWRDSRNLKLGAQFQGGAGGGNRVADTVGAGSPNFGKDGRAKNGDIVKPPRRPGQRSIFESFQPNKDVERPAKRLKTDDDIPQPSVTSARSASELEDASTTKEPERDTQTPTDESFTRTGPNSSPNHQQAVPRPLNEGLASTDKPCPQIFAGLKFYINGSTAPAISDHQLKHTLSKHGGGVSIALGRKTVTHVILGTTSRGGGAGGGLSGSKIQKEIAGRSTRGIKFVTADWVLESVKAGRRLPEARFQALSLAPKGVGSIMNVFGAG